MMKSQRNERKLVLRRGLSILMVEGIDAYYFCIHACEAYGLEFVQVIDFGGITELYTEIEVLKKLPHYEEIPALGILRDAEKDARGAVHSVKSALKRNDLLVPKKPYEIAVGNPSVGFGLFPGTREHDLYDTGTLEDLCMASVKKDKNWKCVDDYLACLQKGETLTHLHKARLHAYLAGKNGMAGMKIGEAAKAGAWDWESVVMQDFRTFLEELNTCAH